MDKKLESKLQEKKGELNSLTEKIKLHLGESQKHQAEAQRLNNEILRCQGEIKALSELSEE